MDVRNPGLLPEELIRLAYYYQTWTKRPVSLRVHVRDPFSPSRKTALAGRVFGEWDEGNNDLFLARIARHHSLFQGMPPGINAWIAVLEVFLHEFGNHWQLSDLNYRFYYDTMGHTAAWPERDARNFAWPEMIHLVKRYLIGRAFRTGIIEITQPGQLSLNDEWF